MSEHDDDSSMMSANEVVWANDTPAMVTAILSVDERTRMTNGTAVEYALADLQPRTFGVLFCGPPSKHAHVSMSAHDSMSFASIIVTVTYTFALALDRTEWRSRIPPEEALVRAWEDVLSVVDDIDEGYGAVVRRIVADMGEPATWTQHFHAGAYSGREHVN